MRLTILASVLAMAASIVPAAAQYDSGYGSNYGYGQGNTWQPGGAYDTNQPGTWTSQGYTVTTPGTRVSPLDGTRRVYPNEPTLGDPRGYRRTDPSTCTGLLCD